MEGVGKLTFLKLGEEYTLTMPYGYGKGILVGSLTMELGGKVTIECSRTGYKTDLEFKLKVSSLHFLLTFQTFLIRYKIPKSLKVLVRFVQFFAAMVWVWSSATFKKLNEQKTSYQAAVCNWQVLLL